MRTATAQQLAAALQAGGHPVSHSGGWHRTRGVCHGGDAPTTLAFRDGERAGESPLLVRCHKCGASSTAIRHALQATTGLPLCRCRDCWQAWRASQTVHGPSNRALPAETGANKSAESRSKRKSGQNRGGDSAQTERTTSDYAAQLWNAGAVSTGNALADHPVRQWLRRFGVWPDVQPLPDGVRWLHRNRLPRGSAPSPAAGALVLAMRPLSDPAAAVRKVQLVAITTDGGKAQHWQNGDKRTYGADSTALGILTHWPHVDSLTGYDLHVVEGLKDGLAVLAGLPYEEHAGSTAAAWRYARAGFVAVAVMAGKGYGGIDPVPFASVTLWPDADDPDALPAAREQGQHWRNTGYETVRIARLPDGYDPAAYANRTGAQNEGGRQKRSADTL